MEIGRTICPKYKTIQVGTKLRIDGTNEWVEITKINDDIAIYVGKNKAGCISKLKANEGQWSGTSTHPLVFDLLDAVEFV